jgi:hypothetical protein
MPLRFVPIPTAAVATLQAGAPDANGQTPELHIARETGGPCRHCLRPIAAGERYLILGYRPFPEPQPYAEVGPIFLHAEACPGYESGDGLPPILEPEGQVIIRGYGDDNRIVYGSGQVVAIGAIRDAAATLLDDERIAYIHVRSASNNCYQCRIDRA